MGNMQIWISGFTPYFITRLGWGMCGKYEDWGIYGEYAEKNFDMDIWIQTRIYENLQELVLCMEKYGMSGDLHRS